MMKANRILDLTLNQILVMKSLLDRLRLNLMKVLRRKTFLISSGMKREG